MEEELEITCKCCGAIEYPERYINCDELIERQLCFKCNFWRETLELDKNRKWCVIDGIHYVLGNHVHKGIKGFGGHNFTIKFKDGHIEECDNLWCQGDIPAEYRTVFPDNAEFINN